MAKSPEGRDKEYYLGEIRKLKAENRNLKKRIRQLEKSEALYDNFIEESEIPDLPIGNSNEKLPNPCLSCGKGFMIEKNIIGRTYEECAICGDRTPVKKYEDIKE